MPRKKKVEITDNQFDLFLVQVGARLKDFRLEAGYTSYEQFAYEHEIGRAQYGKYERGTEDLRLSSLYKILKKMDIPFEDFFKGIK